MVVKVPWWVRWRAIYRQLMMIAGAFYSRFLSEFGVAGDRFAMYFRGEITAGELLSDFGIGEWAIERAVSYAKARAVLLRVYRCHDCSGLHLSVFRAPTQKELQAYEKEIARLPFKPSALEGLPISAFREGCLLQLVYSAIHHYRAAGWDEPMIERRICKAFGLDVPPQPRPPFPVARP